MGIQDKLLSEKMEDINDGYGVEEGMKKSTFWMYLRNQLTYRLNSARAKSNMRYVLLQLIYPRAVCFVY